MLHAGQVPQMAGKPQSGAARPKLKAGIVVCPNGSARGAEYVLGEAMRALLQALATEGEPLVLRTLADR